MSARPWGTTGRVTLSEEPFDGIQATTWVHLHGRPVARAFHPRASFPHYGVDAEPPLVAYREGFPTLNAAVMWVLRRAAPDVWRDERGTVPAVMRSSDEIEWFYGTPVDAESAQLHYFPTWAEALAAAMEATP